MATISANDSRPRGNYSREAKSYHDRKPGASPNYRSDTVINQNTNKDDKSYNKTYGNSSTYKGAKKFNHETNSKENDYKPINKNFTESFGVKTSNRGKEPNSFSDKSLNKSNNNRYKSKDYVGGGYYKDKDELDTKYEKSYGKEKSPCYSRTKSSQAKDKEQQPDKLEIIKRIEREKKVITKKSQEHSIEKERPAKAAMKQRRTSTIDWTKGYEKGLYGDDDEDYTTYC